MQWASKSLLMICGAKLDDYVRCARQRTAQHFGQSAGTALCLESEQSQLRSNFAEDVRQMMRHCNSY